MLILSPETPGVFREMTLWSRLLVTEIAVLSQSVVCVDTAGKNSEALVYVVR
jgi:hypothetical protein